MEQKPRMVVTTSLTDRHLSMRLSLLRSFRGSPSIHQAVSRDADELIQQWGSAAFERATDLSWREDSGLTVSPHPGHWWSVRREIERRLGRTIVEPAVNIAA